MRLRWNVWKANAVLIMGGTLMMLAFKLTYWLSPEAGLTLACAWEDGTRGSNAEAKKLMRKS